MVTTIDKLLTKFGGALMLNSTTIMLFDVIMNLSKTKYLGQYETIFCLKSNSVHKLYVIQKVVEKW